MQFSDDRNFAHHILRVHGESADDHSSALHLDAKNVNRMVDRGWGVVAPNDTHHFLGRSFAWQVHTPFGDTAWLLERNRGNWQIYDQRAGLPIYILEKQRNWYRDGPFEQIHAALARQDSTKLFEARDCDWSKIVATPRCWSRNNARSKLGLRANPFVQ